MRNSGLKEAQTGIKIAGRNINILRYADDTTLMAESEELKSLLMKVKEENEQVGFFFKFYFVFKLYIGWGTHVYLWRIHFDIWQN